MPTTLQKFEPFPDLTPLIDTVFLLILFFALTFSFSRETVLSLELPQAKRTAPSAGAGLAIDVTSENTVLLDGRPVTRKELAGRLARERAAKRVTIRADRRAIMDTVVSVWDAAREAGFEELEIVTRPGGS
jgi:biopolymer transport protein ExbD